MDWICMMLDAHFTVLVMTPEAKGFLLNLHGFVRSQVTSSPFCQPVTGWNGRKNTITCVATFLPFSTGEAVLWTWKDRGQSSGTTEDEAEARCQTILNRSHWDILESMQRNVLVNCKFQCFTFNWFKAIVVWMGLTYCFAVWPAKWKNTANLSVHGRVWRW